MCGIVAGFNINQNKNPVNEDIATIYEDQFHRGIKGFGTIFINENKSFNLKRATEPIKFMVQLLQPSNKTTGIIAHHRFPSSSENKISQTHPILVSNKELKYDYLVIHNGGIANDKWRKVEQEKLGYEYTTARITDKNFPEHNDSEALAIDLARFIEQKDKTIPAVGTAAFIAIAISKKTTKINRIFFGRNSGNPLNLAKSNKQIRISSEGPGNEIKENILYSFNLKDFKIQKRKINIKKTEGVIIYHYGHGGKSEIGFQEPQTKAEQERIRKISAERIKNEKELKRKNIEFMEKRLGRRGWHELPAQEIQAILTEVTEDTRIDIQNMIDDAFDLIIVNEKEVWSLDQKEFIDKHTAKFANFLKSAIQDSQDSLLTMYNVTPEDMQNPEDLDKDIPNFELDDNKLETPNIDTTKELKKDIEKDFEQKATKKTNEIISRY